MAELVKEKNKSSKYGLFALGVVGTSVIGIGVVTSSFILPAFRKVCLPFVPATNEQVKNVMTALHRPCRRGMTVVDIGSGDGRIVFASAAHGFHATGHELNIPLVLFSKFKSFANGLSHRARFERQDLWKANYSGYDNVVIFGVEEMMPALEEKLLKEMSDGTRIIACRFPLPHSTPSQVIGSGLNAVWSYDVTKT